ncbi:hypothetical protein N9R79_11420 [Vibrio sp.]|nr:hypothetical protein [Vibrio sp.]
MKGTSSLQKQKGIATLLVTSLLVSSALVVSMSSYKNVFYQIKRAQNEVKSRQSHWMAEGGLECAYAQYQLNGAIPTSLTDCGSGLANSMTMTTGTEGIVVTSANEYAGLHKVIQGGGSIGNGAIQTTADLYFRGSVNFYVPDPGDFNTTEDGWECTVLKYKSRVHLNASATNSGLKFSNYDPFEDFDSQAYGDKDCAASHKTNGGGSAELNATLPSTVKNDFQHDPNLSLFDSFFGVSKSAHDTIRDNGKFAVLYGVDVTSSAPLALKDPDTGVVGTTTGYVTVKKVPECGKAIAEKISKDKERFIWVEGGCEISSENYNSLVAKTQSEKDGVLIVVHDGILSIMNEGTHNSEGQGSGNANGSPSNAFKGVIFHFNHNYKPSFNDWMLYSGANKVINASSPVFPLEYRQNAAFYQHGSPTAEGGTFLDLPNQSALYNASLAYYYNRDIISSLQGELTEQRWQKGSWYAN